MIVWWPKPSSTTKSSTASSASTTPTGQRTVAVIDRLVALGSLVRMPMSRSRGDGLFELRFTLGPTARRITYLFTPDGRIVLLTPFRKQRNNERSEVTRARAAAADCVRSHH
jgi:phage-related protein